MKGLAIEKGGGEGLGAHQDAAQVERRELARLVRVKVRVRVRASVRVSVRV